MNTGVSKDTSRQRGLTICLLRYRAIRCRQVAKHERDEEEEPEEHEDQRYAAHQCHIHAHYLAHHRNIQLPDNRRGRRLSTTATVTDSPP